MANNKPASRSWTDIQMVLAAFSMALTLGLWNLFAEPDRVAAADQKAQQAPDVPVTDVTPTLAAPAVPTQTGPIKILLGGLAPQTTIVVQQARRGGGGPVPQTRSS